MGRLCMFVVCLWVSVAALGCGSVSMNDDVAADAPAPERVLALPVELAEAGAAAAGLWVRAGYGVPRPTIADAGALRVLLVDGLIADCQVDAAWGCTDLPMFPGDTAYMWISSEVPQSQLTSVLAHELGHYLGLEHTTDGTLMDPNRSLKAFEHPQVAARF